MQREAAATTVADLPDALLGRIFQLGCDLRTLAAPFTRRAISAVCKRWRHIIFSERELWRAVRVHYPDYSTGKRTFSPWELSKEEEAWLLQQVGGMVEDVELWGRLAGLAHLLRPEVLRRLLLSVSEYDYKFVPAEQRAGHAAAVVVEALRRFPALQSLTLYCDSLVADMSGSLQRQRHLGSLKVCLRASAMPTAALDAALQLSSLTQLRLCSRRGFGAELQQGLLQLTRLRQLASLELEGDGEEVLTFPCPAAFPALESYRFSRCVYRAGDMLIAGTLLCRCSFRWSKQTYRPRRHESKLSVAGLEAEAGALPLLGALLPPGAPPPSALSLKHGLMTYGPLAGLGRALGAPGLAARLNGITMLKLRGFQVLDSFDDGAQNTLPELLAQLLPLMPKLADLTIDGGLAAVVPPCVAGLTGLTALELPHNHLVDLPTGDYLTGLISLDLDGNKFKRAPPALATATRLRRLSLYYCHGLRYGEEYSYLRSEPADSGMPQMLPLVQRLREQAELGIVDSDAEASDDDWA